MSDSKYNLLVILTNSGPDHKSAIPHSFPVPPFTPEKLEILDLINKARGCSIQHEYDLIECDCIDSFNSFKQKVFQPSESRSYFQQSNSRVLSLLQPKLVLFFFDSIYRLWIELREENYNVLLRSFKTASENMKVLVLCRPKTPLPLLQLKYRSLSTIESHVQLLGESLVSSLQSEKSQQVLQDANNIVEVEDDRDDLAAVSLRENDVEAVIDDIPSPNINVQPESDQILIPSDNQQTNDTSSPSFNAKRTKEIADTSTIPPPVVSNALHKKLLQNFPRSQFDAKTDAAVKKFERGRVAANKFLGYVVAYNPQTHETLYQCVKCNNLFLLTKSNFENSRCYCFLKLPLFLINAVLLINLASLQQHVNNNERRSMSCKSIGNNASVLSFYRSSAANVVSNLLHYNGDIIFAIYNVCIYVCCALLRDSGVF